MADQGLAATIANALAGNKEGYMPDGWNSFTHANTPADLVSKPGLFKDMFTDRTISLPNSPQMQQEMLDTYNNIGKKFGTGFIKGSPLTYAGWNLNEKQAQEFENQINNIDMTNWDADYNLTANPSSTGVNPFGSMGANPHQDTFTAQEKTGAGFKPGHTSQGVVGKAIADIAHAIFGKGSGKTTFGFGVPHSVSTPVSTTPAPASPVASPVARAASPRGDGVSDHDPYGRKAAAAAASARKSSMARAAKARAKSKASKKGGGRGKGKAPGGAPKGGHHKGLSFSGGRGTSKGGAPRGGHHAGLSFGGGGDGGDSHGGGDGGSGEGGWT